MLSENFQGPAACAAGPFSFGTTSLGHRPCYWEGNESVEIRFAEESDLPAVMMLVNRAFEVETFFITGERLNSERAREYFDQGRYLIAEESGVPAGCVYVQLHGERSYLGLLSVHPDLQKTGLGRKLMAAAEEFAREMGSHHMDLTVVNLRTELPPFYRKLGYVEDGTEPIRDHMLPRVTQPCHFVKMTKPLGNG
jgi:GNAT superfamily N-acetyltransferase